jgi:hypothetical protein
MSKFSIKSNLNAKFIRALILFIFCLILIITCTPTRIGIKDKYKYLKELELGKPHSLRPEVISEGNAQACEACMEGRYYHQYTISDGVNAGNVWLCCVPINELARESFHCSCVLNLAYLGNELDRKVQFCLLIDALSTEPNYIPACIPAPLSTSPTIIHRPE